jgi:anti-sigma regulatory factor (Ser/Thr protein kinase)
LQPIAETFTGSITARVSDAGLQPELSLEELVRQAKPAVVYLKGRESSGSGFFVTGTGVRTLEVLKSSKVSLKATLEPIS